MLMRFARAFVTFVGLIVPGALVMALLAAPPAKPAPFQPQGCPHNLQAAGARVAASEAHLRNGDTRDGTDMCRQTRLHFLAVVKARALTARCTQGPARERALRRFDADVAHINTRIAAACKERVAQHRQRQR